MSWDEFITLLGGLNHKTPLGSIVSIRSETDRDVIKNFTPEQRKIRNDWLKKNAKNIDKKAYERDMNMFENMFRGLSKVGDHIGRR